MDESMPYFVTVKFHGISLQDIALKIGARIRRARRHAGLSQVQLSTLLAVQRSAVSNWESGNNIYPTMANLIAIACACGVTIEWLGTGRGTALFDAQDLAHIPAAHAELVEEPIEHELLAAFRVLPTRSQELFLDLINTFIAFKPRRRKAQPANRSLAGNPRKSAR